uniref:Uncharacterized protein n=1 Tax=Timema cristinae TaxID=61476 RepID=A0A7R9CUR2_TIMCR|nr:unnamed protein product [Timema cristinae]
MRCCVLLAGRRTRNLEANSISTSVEEFNNAASRRGRTKTCLGREEIWLPHATIQFSLGNKFRKLEQWRRRGGLKNRKKGSYE